MAWYRAGSVAVTNGSAVVTGAGTDFVANTSVGEAFLGPDARVYEIAQVVSATQIVLSAAYQGAGAGGQGYAVLPTQSLARDLAMGVASLLNRYGVVADGVGMGLFPDGSQATPAFRFAADQDTGIRRAGDNAVSIVTGGVDRLLVGADGAVTIPVTGDRRFSANFTINSGIWKLRSRTGFDAGEDGASKGSIGLYFGDQENAAVDFMRGGDGVAGHIGLRTSDVERVRVNDRGLVGIGTTNPRASLEVFRSNPSTPSLMLASSFAPFSYVELNAGVNGVSNGGFDLRLGGTSRLTIDDTGNLLVGVSSGAFHRIEKSVSEGGVAVLGVRSSSTGQMSLQVNPVAGEVFSYARAALFVGRDSSTGRSANLGGTLNAQGADYAEYMLKAAGCGRIAKGDVCGVDRDGRLTKTWADAISFVVKSTDPSLVGGDTWDAAVGPRPEQPGAEPVEPASPLEPADEADDAEREAWAAAIADHPAQVAAYRRAHAGWQAATDAHAEALTAWEAEHEKARQCVDRIAFCGQVPVNVTGEFSVGDYVIAAANGAGIEAIAIADAEITFDQYRRRIGKIWAVRDGRAWVDVQHG